MEQTLSVCSHHCSLQEQEGSKSDCGNYRGISILSVAGKIFARILLKQLITDLQKKSTRGAVWLQTKAQDRGHDICRQVGAGEVHWTKKVPHSDLTDLTEAFDTFSREALWTFLVWLPKEVRQADPAAS